MRRLAIAFVSCALFACQPAVPATKTPPPGTLGDVARQVTALVAPNADVLDQPLEDLMTRVDLQKAYSGSAGGILDQVRKTRAAVAAMRASASSASGSHLASVAHAVSEFSVPFFAKLFADSLEQLTRTAETLSLPGRPFSSTESGPDSFTTTTLSDTESFTGSGPQVTGMLHWTYTTITVSTKPGGATLLHLQDDRELVGVITVCPDASGSVPASLHMSTKLIADVAGTTTTRSSTGDVTFTGKVSDQAALTTVLQQTKIETSSTSAAGTGGYSADYSVQWTAGSSGGLLDGQLDTSSLGGSLVARGIASDADAAKGAGWDTALSAFAMNDAFKSAQALWRAGRCVVVMAPDYTAETSIRVEEQTKPQNDEAVDADSETKFSVKLRHRFDGGSLTQPITANLSGDKTLEPNRLDSAGTLTYKAPAEDDKKATATLKSTSKRGIGTLVLDFHTGHDALTLTIKGTLNAQQPYPGGIGSVTTSDNVSFGPIEFKKDGDHWIGKGTWTDSVHEVSEYVPVRQVCDGNESGPAQFLARMETRGNAKVWVIDIRNSAAASGPGTMDCVVSSPGATQRASYPTNGSSAGQFLILLADIVIPADGGSVAVQGQSGDWHAQGTATGTTKK